MSSNGNINTGFEGVAHELAARIGAQLPGVILELLQSGVNLTSDSLQLECSLSSAHDGVGRPATRLRVASVGLDSRMTTPVSQPTPSYSGHTDMAGFRDFATRTPADAVVPAYSFRPGDSTIPTAMSVVEDDQRPAKRRKATAGPDLSSESSPVSVSNIVSQPIANDARPVPHKKKRLPDNPSMQPSTLEKFTSGVWESLFSGVKLDPLEVIEQWQAIESSGQPRLLLDADQEASHSADGQSTAVQGMFGRMNVLTRRISQTSRISRSLEVVVQAFWVSCFDSHVAELAGSMPRDKAKKTAMAQACADFKWSEKELRNKMGIWRGYHDIRLSGGWAALVFAGMGLYRFCKYRVSFNEETFQTLRALRHRWEVAADTLHPRWRQLLGIIGAPTEREYTGHPHDWVVAGPSNQALPLAPSYYKWDPEFSYVHLEESVIDEEIWGHFDPRTVVPDNPDDGFKCPACDEQQSDDPAYNSCNCFPNLYGSTKTGVMPVQVFRTPEGKNNGLIACAPFEQGAAVGEFIGLITSGLANMDVMIGQTEKATYQISQRRMGNHIRFVNHSCQPNSQFERFVWLGKQRVVLVSKGVNAGEEITVDYSDMYWRNLDKVCLCGYPECRYKDRERHVLTPPESEG